MLASTLKKKLNEIESSYPEILLFYTFYKQKTAEVHFTATFGEYLILIYFSKIL